MTISNMRAIDRYLGVFLCWIVGGARMFRRSTAAAQMPAEPTRVLILKFFGLGSIILSTTAISLLRKSYPNVKIDFVTFYQHKELLQRYSFVESIFTIRTDSLGLFLRDTFSVILKIRNRRYDIAFDFEFFSKYSTLLSTLSGTAVRVGFALPARWRSLHLTHQVPLRKDQHVSRAFCEQIFLLSGTQPIPAPAAPDINEADHRSMADTLPLNGAPIMIVNVNAGDTFPERRWQPERFAQIINTLAPECLHDFYFIGVESESSLINEVIRSTSFPRRCFNIAGMLTIPELAALFQRSEFILSNDSGPVHLADVVGLRGLALYGPESPAFYGPVGQRITTFTKSIPCSPCMNVYAAKSFRCPYDAACMKAISGEDVLSLVNAAGVKM